MFMIRLRGEFVTESENHDAERVARAATRGPIQAWSRRSASRLRAYLAGSVALYRGMVTLTYPGWGEYVHQKHDRAKRDLRAFFGRYRREHAGRVHLGSVVWCMEHTKAGTIHFHLLVNHWIDHVWVARAWYDVVGTDDIRHLQAGTKTEALRNRGAALRYVAKYLSKESLERQSADSGNHTGRWWGVVGDRRQVEASIRVIAGQEGSERAIQHVRTAVYRVLNDWIAAGKCKEVDTSRFEDIPSTVRMWRIPSWALRVSLKSMMATWMFDSQLVLHDWGETDEYDLDPVGL